MEEENHPSFQQERFVREFIAIYKENRLLWDKNHPNHKKRDERALALELLLHKCREYYPEADPDFVVHKINTMRTCFRRQYKHVLESRKTCSAPSEVYKPALWYYNLLLFTVGEKAEAEAGFGNKGTEFLQNKVSCWTREYTVLLINLFKHHPVLHSPNVQDNNKPKRRAALQTITEELTALTGKKFRYEDVKKKLIMLKGQYRKHLHLHRTTNKPNTQKLWCYDLLDDFLRDHTTLSVSRKTRSETKKDAAISDSELVENSISGDIKQEDNDLYEHKNMDNDMKLDSDHHDSSDEDYDDIFDTIGKNVAHKLRDMVEEQSCYCEKIITNILYYGLMGHLTYSTTLDL